MAVRSIKSVPFLTNPIDEVMDAQLIWTQAGRTAEVLLESFQVLRKKRGLPRGRTTADEQDLLRSMLVMACAGFDSSMKQLLRDALPKLVSTDRDANAKFQDFLTKELTSNDERGSRSAAKFLAAAISSGEVVSYSVESYVRSLIGDSFQSAERVCAVAGALAIPLEKASIDVAKLRIIFAARNQIIHELDVALHTTSRLRHPRGTDDMIDYVDEIMRLGSVFLLEVQMKIGMHPSYTPNKFRSKPSKAQVEKSAKAK